MSININRRVFLSGVLAALAFSFIPAFALADKQPASAEKPAPTQKPASAEKPNLVFGVLSDTHLRRAWGSETPARAFPTKYVRGALEYFRDQGVDAVVHCGDFAHRGLTCEMQFHANLWFKVFPDNKGKDGKPVEKLFVTGNHDWIGSGYGNFADLVYPTNKYPPSVRQPLLAQRVLATNIVEKWQAIWHEPYTRSWHKCVKGYHFFGEHFEGSYKELAGKIAASAKDCQLKGKRPFFVLQHMRPGKPLAKTLSKYPNSVMFFGHWHMSLASECTSFCDKFSLFQCASLRVNALMKVPGCQFEENESELLDPADRGGGRQGMLVKVYDDRLVITRRDFINNASLGPDWVLPLGKYKPNPFSRKELAKTLGAPAFPETTKLTATRTAEELVVSIPQANALPKVRAYAFELRIKRASGEEAFKICRHASGCNFAPTSKVALAPTVVKIPTSKLPSATETLSLTVTPVSALGRRGKPLKLDLAGK